MWTDAARARVLTARTAAPCATCGAEIQVTLIRAGQVNYCKSCYKRQKAEAGRERYHRLREQGMTVKQWKTRGPKVPLSPAGQHQSRKPTITILHDMCDAPMAAGAMISQEEYYAGFRCGAWVAGTVFAMPGGYVEVAGWER